MTVRDTHRSGSGGHASDRTEARTEIREQIMSAFLEVATERGLDSVTTRLIAQAAGVHEVTIFRHFGDKTGLALAAVRHFSPAEDLRRLRPDIDLTSPAATRASMVACLRECQAMMRRHPALLQFGITQAHRMPEVEAETTTIPLAITGFLERVLEAAAPALRPEVDRPATVLQWMGILSLAPILIARGVIPAVADEGWDRLFEAAVRVIVADPAPSSDEPPEENAQ